MQASHPAPTAKRRDSLVGVCAAIGEDFGFNPDILRIALTAALLWNPLVVLASYGVAGLFVLASRRLFPKTTRVVPMPVPEAVVPSPEAAPAENEMAFAHAA